MPARREHRGCRDRARERRRRTRARHAAWAPARRAAARWGPLPLL